MIRSTHLACAALLGTAVGGLAGCGTDNVTPNPIASPSTPFSKLNHLVVIYLENHSFDNLYGEFAAPAGGFVDGLKSASGTQVQVDATGLPYAVLPPAMDTSKTPPVVVSTFSNLPNQPFAIEDHVPDTMEVPDLVHRYYQQQKQIDTGRMDQFALVSNAGALTMGHYHTAGLPLATFATTYVLCDQFFHSAFGGSFLNHQWLIAAATPVFPNAPADLKATFDPMTLKMVLDGAVTPDDFVVNTAYSGNQPVNPVAAKQDLVPDQTAPTIGDRLNDAMVTWAWYSGGWNDALAGKPDPSFQYHHQPFVYYKSFADGTANKKAYLKDEADFVAAATAGSLPSVSFVKPLGVNNEHPGYADIVDSENHVVTLINAVKNGANWKDTAIIITYDENGGFWDHVAPPKFDRWGQGARVPAIIVSPYAKAGYVDHTKYETVSILATIEHRFGLQPLASRDALASDLLSSFDFTKP